MLRMSNSNLTLQTPQTCSNMFIQRKLLFGNVQGLMHFIYGLKTALFPNTQIDIQMQIHLSFLTIIINS